MDDSLLFNQQKEQEKNIDLNRQLLQANSGTYSPVR